MQLSVKELSAAADTAAQGELVLDALSRALKSGDVIILDFSGVTTATSSFTNTAIVPLLAEYSLDYLRKHLRIVKSTKQINDMIKMRLERASGSAAA
ncbi:STAS-like domain-containing protein [Bradyrhizobium sp. SZCCHNR1075]|uniref:STAS-like domain-containing protein n=1 Tax=Bradyrhizobium sp. SZCCHNR1075 TaxID=3057362 RepID=UPI0028EB166F|nr:STAS-like domain-containing protein [Bradyrhizobium sp. SZCCHNR1075]